MNSYFDMRGQGCGWQNCSQQMQPAQNWGTYPATHETIPPYSYPCPGTAPGSLEEDYVPAMAYVPWQQWNDTYPLEQAVLRGTIFPELDLEFQYGRCAR